MQQILEISRRNMFLCRLNGLRHFFQTRNALRRAAFVSLTVIAILFVAMEASIQFPSTPKEPPRPRSKTAFLIQMYVAFNFPGLTPNSTSLDQGQRLTSNPVGRDRFPLWFPNLVESKSKLESTSPPPSQPPSPSFYNLLSLGQSISIASHTVTIPTAVAYTDSGREASYRVLINGWARDWTGRHLVCCFLHSLNNDPRLRKPFETKAVLGRLSPESTSQTQNAEFCCSAAYSDIRSSGYFSHFKYLALSESNCTKPSRDVIRIEYPEVASRSVGLCVILPRRSLDPEFLVEWLEWHRLQGVTEVNFYHEQALDIATARVFEYYSSIGFVRSLYVPRPEEAARLQYEFSDVMATNDCKHRMHKFDYVIAMDVDEVLAPRNPITTIHQVLKNVSSQHPLAGVFEIHSLHVATDWKPSRRSPLHLARHQVHHPYLNLGLDQLFARWAFRPTRVDNATKRKAKPKHQYTEVSIPASELILLRFRKCPVQLWSGCLHTLMGVKDEIVSRFEASLIVSMRQLPLEFILPYNLHYARRFDNVFVPGDWSYYGPRDNITKLE